MRTRNHKPETIAAIKKVAELKKHGLKNKDIANRLNVTLRCIQQYLQWSKHNG